MKPGKRPAHMALTFSVGKPVIPKSAHTCWLASSAQSMAASITAGLHSAGTENVVRTAQPLCGPKNCPAPHNRCGDLPLSQHTALPALKRLMPRKRPTDGFQAPNTRSRSPRWCLVPYFLCGRSVGKAVRGGTRLCTPCPSRHPSTGSSARSCLPVRFCLPSLCPTRNRLPGEGEGWLTAAGGKAGNTGSSLSHPRPRTRLITKRE